MLRTATCNDNQTKQVFFSLVLSTTVWGVDLLAWQIKSRGSRNGKASRSDSHALSDPECANCQCETVGPNSIMCHRCLSLLSAQLRLTDGSTQDLFIKNLLSVAEEISKVVSVSPCFYRLHLI